MARGRQASSSSISLAVALLLISCLIHTGAGIAAAAKPAKNIVQSGNYSNPNPCEQIGLLCANGYLDCEFESDLNFNDNQSGVSSHEIIVGPESWEGAAEGLSQCFRGYVSCMGSCSSIRASVRM